MVNHQVIEKIKTVARNVLPKGSALYLYGSRARGDFHADSDWDLLLLLDKSKIENEDFNKYSFFRNALTTRAEQYQRKESNISNCYFYSLFNSAIPLTLN
ncbi:MAG: nucleotidyltransferase domain-containing protein [Bacteroidaceae bacterium]|nr:nucleotidyltransferase domain-containing protein [Bacteroidaceae bacterium]